MQLLLKELFGRKQLYYIKKLIVMKVNHYHLDIQGTEAANIMIKPLKI